MPNTKEKYPYGYTIINNIILRDKRLPNSVKYLLILMLSLPADWHYTAAGLAAICHDSISAITRQLQILEKYGYLTRQTKRDAHGKFLGNIYIIREIPIADTPVTDTPVVDNPVVAPPAKDYDSIQTKKSEKKNISKDSNQSIINLSTADLTDQIKRQLEYNILCCNPAIIRTEIDRLISIIVDTLYADQPYFEIGNHTYPASKVRQRLYQLNSDHIVYVLNVLRAKSTPIRNIKQYLLALLINPPLTVNQYDDSQY